MIIGTVLMVLSAAASHGAYLSVKNAQWVDDEDMEL